MKERSFDSSFLTGISVPEHRLMNRTLVIGGDWAGLELSERLAKAGLDVLLLGYNHLPKPLPGVTRLTGAELTEIRGFVGAFTAIIRTDEGIMEERVGSVVSAGPPRVEADSGPEGLSIAAEGILTLSELEDRLASGQHLGNRKGAWLHVAFLHGLGRESQPAVFARILDVLEKISRMESSQAYVFTRNLKVASPDLERRYRDCRNSGTLFFKFDDDGPTFPYEEGRQLMVFKDPLLHTEMELAPDLMVLDETMLPPLSVEPLLKAIPSSPSFRPFLEPESPRFPGIETPKAGLYAMGPSRGVFDSETIRGDIDAVVAALVGQKPKEDRTGWGAPYVDGPRCAMCLTCVRLCPHGAMGFSEKAEADPVSCVRCGICAAECPMAAITLTRPASTDQAAQGPATGRSKTGSIVAFLCSRSAADAFERLDSALVRNVTKVTVPCAGTVSVSDILNALVGGAAGVLVAGCYKGNCASVYGTVLAEQRTAETRRVLEEAGVPPSSVLFVSTASNSRGNLAAALQDLEGLVLKPAASA